ncbi:lysine transporter LysE [Roseobacter cerasinus]|uniref:Lysine transporter LysE n=1 Tax=Roseobacter cerasinus TaxID=2602289 RepID=A0A640VTW7_9RHOB|nr:LysE family translocator [Roseobacter cerasinus]GFE51102.1 lysine transporter LysE [Roseobacter cerasinus]
MIDILSLGVFALALILNAGTPGPSIAALVSRVISNGWQDVLPFVAAMWLGEVIWLTLAMVGLSALAETFHGAFLVLKYLGVAYLLWLAWKMWHQPVEQTQEPLPRRRSPMSMFAAGMALTLGNPKITIFYLALLPSLIDLTDVTFSMWAVVTMVTVLSLASVDFAWIALASRARTFLRTPRAIRVANRIGASCLGGAAGAIATRG